MKVRDRILIITDLILGALYADATMTGEEDRSVRELLAKLLLCSPKELPAHVVDRIKNFSLLTFDIELLAKDFLADPPMKKRRLIELIGALTDKDGTDLREDDYMRDLAQCLGMQPEEYQDLVLNYEMESLRQSFEFLRVPADVTDGSTPPPADPEAALPRWRRKALKEKRDSERRLEAQKAVSSSGEVPAASEGAPVETSGVHASFTEHTPGGRPKTVPPPIPAGAKSGTKP